jgi:acetate kinase
MAKGIADRIGMSSGCSIAHKPNGKNEVVLEQPLSDHRAALLAIEEILVHPEYGVIADIKEISGVGHRVVHGGEKFTRSILINDSVIAAIQENAKLAPLHNPPNILGIEVCQQLLPEVPNVAVFDTAIHQTMPKKAYLYGLPMELYEKHGIRKYGFHGTSHGYVARRAAALMKKPFEQAKIITCHLGNGCSIAAFSNGKIIDTSMGLTPLEGVVMGTRCGDLDPAVVLYLMEMLGLSLQQTNDLLNKQSGLKGLCGKADMRDIVKIADQGDSNAQTAIEVFIYRIQKYIGAYAAALNGTNAIVFTAGIGENSPYLRQEVLSKFDYLGLKIDLAKNKVNEPVFSTPDSRVYAMMIPTNEELVIAQETHELITRR